MWYNEQVMKKEEKGFMKEVIVRIKSIQVSREAGDDEIEFVTEAQLYQRGGATYLIYDESELSGIPGCKTRLRLKGDEVQMKRFGEGPGCNSELKFEKGKRYNGFYDTPFGPIEIEILTNSLEGGFMETEEGEPGQGEFNIDYEISLKGLLEGRNRLNIKVM